METVTVTIPRGLLERGLEDLLGTGLLQEHEDAAQEFGDENDLQALSDLVDLLTMAGLSA